MASVRKFINVSLVIEYDGTNVDAILAMIGTFTDNGVVQTPSAENVTVDGNPALHLFWPAEDLLDVDDRGSMDYTFLPGDEITSTGHGDFGPASVDIADALSAGAAWLAEQ